MDFGESVPLIASIIGLILLQFFLRRGRKLGATPQTIAQSLLSEVSLNLALTEVFQLHWRTKKFETTSWQMSKTKLDFLGQSLQVVLSDAFMMVEDFNQQIAAAKKYKSTSYMVNVNIDKLKEPLTKSKQGLEEWLLSNIGTKEPPPKYPGMFGSLFSGRG